MANSRALEEEAMRYNPVEGARGAGAVPSSGLSQFRGGAHSEAHEQGAMLGQHLRDLHGSGYMDSFRRGMAPCNCNAGDDMPDNRFYRARGGARTGSYEGEGRHRMPDGSMMEDSEMKGGSDDMARVVGGFLPGLLSGVMRGIMGLMGSGTGGKRPSKAKMMKALAALKKERPDKASEIADRLRMLRGGMTGAGVLDDVYKFIMGLFGKKGSPAAAAPSGPAPSAPPRASAPAPSAPAEESAAAQLAKEGITDRKSFMKWAVKNHPDKASGSAGSPAFEAASAKFKKFNSLAGQLGYSGGKREKRVVGEDDGRRKRAEVVRRVMKEKGCSMIEASKHVKAHGLY